MTTFAESQTLGRARFLSLARQMDWFRGLRAAVALCTPLVIGDLAGLSILGWAALGGFEAILADTGGPYRSRLASLATLSVGGATGLFSWLHRRPKPYMGSPRHHHVLLLLELSRRSRPAVFLGGTSRPSHLHLRYWCAAHQLAHGA